MRLNDIRLNPKKNRSTKKKTNFP